MKHSINRCI